MDIWFMSCQFTTRKTSITVLRWQLSTFRRHLFGKKKLNQSLISIRNRKELMEISTIHLSINLICTTGGMLPHQIMKVSLVLLRMKMILIRTCCGEQPLDEIPIWQTRMGVTQHLQKPKSCSRAMKAVGVVEASCEDIFELAMSMDATCFELVWPRDLCYVRYWRRNDDGSYVVLFRSREHENCGPLPGYVRAHVESGGFNISPLKALNGRPKTQVQHLMQIDLKGWGVDYISSFQQHCLLQMLNSVAGFWRRAVLESDQRTPMDSRFSSGQQSSHHRQCIQGADQEVMPPSPEHETNKAALEEEPLDQIDFSIFLGNLRRDDRDNSRNCWRISDGNNFRVRSKNFCYDKSKIPAGKPLMDLVAVDWFKDTKRMDHVTRRPGCAAQVATEKGLFSLVFNVQVPGSTHYSMVFYFVMKELTPGSLLQRFVDGDDEFRNSRMKLIPSVPKGSWIVRQSVGSTPCLLGKAVDCNYIRGPKYLEIDVDIGSSTVANGVLGLVIGVITSLVVDMAFLVQGNTSDELPEQLIGAVRASHIELSSAILPKLEPDTSK
ncbi:unnamed protein product [Withania somnifera]